MIIKYCNILIFIIILNIISLPLSVFAEEKPDMLFYYSFDCEHCITVKQEFLPGFLDKYGEHFNFIELEVSKTSNFDSLFAMESRLNIPESDKEYPAVYFMGSMLEGEIPVRMRLEYLVKNYLSNPDSAKKVDSEVMSRIPEIIEAGTFESAKKVYMAYFYEQGCKKCGRAEDIVEWLESLYDIIEIEKFDIDSKNNKVTATALGLRTGVPEDRLMSTPSFFIGGEDFLLSENITRKNLAGLVEKHAKTGTEPVWRTMPESEREQARSKIKEQFQAFVLLAILLAGFGDGINPCAFATILFFVSYLGMVGRKKNEILIVGISFAFAVFVTYFLVGLGFFQFMKTATNIDVLAKIIFGATSALCFVFGGLSISDYFKAKAGKTSDMSLQLPEFLKKRIHATIRKKARMESMVAGALIAGFMVSILEFACTGQVYLPTITFMFGMEGYKARAVLYLFLYNICFIIPLLIVFGVVYFGVSSKSIARIMEAKIGMVKLVLALVFFVIGGLLFWAVFSRS